jgi:hypothetical protein
MSAQRMILCGGLQSSGSTLLSWCFLQRRDTNGVLDMPHDTIRTVFAQVREPILWCKMTIGAFRWSDMRDVYTDLGWAPEPFLVVRDVRAVLSSLVRKDYGFNGTTAEEPPLRMRLRRFLHDWTLFRSEGWPIVRYEDLLEDGPGTLRRACLQLGLAWDEAMLSWPKSLLDIAYVHEPNETFAASLAAGSLAASTISHQSDPLVQNLPAAELDWLEDTFAEYNAALGYPSAIPCSAEDGGPLLPRFEGTAREWYVSERERLLAENWALLEQIEQLRSGRRAKA